MKCKLIDALLVLAAAVIVLLAFWAMQAIEPRADQGAEAAASEPALSPDTDVVALAVPELTAAPEPTPAPEPDKPTYDPAIPLAEDLQYILWAACEEHNVDPAIALGVIEVESRFDSKADNGLCYGLMRLNRRYFPSDLPAGENVRYGVDGLQRRVRHREPGIRQRRAGRG